MIRRGDDGDENKAGISNAEEGINGFPQRRFPDLAFLERTSENASVVNHRATDDEGVPKMHAGHCREGIDVVAAHPDAVCVVMSDRVQEAVLRREEPWRHAGVQAKCYKSEKIHEG